MARSPALDGNIHQSASTLVERGSAGDPVACGQECSRSPAERARGWPRKAAISGRHRPAPRPRSPARTGARLRAARAGSSTISVAERSGYSGVPMAKRLTGCKRVPACPRQRSPRSAATSGAPEWKAIQSRTGACHATDARCSGVVPSASVSSSVPRRHRQGRGRGGAGQTVSIRPGRAMASRRGAKGPGRLRRAHRQIRRPGHRGSWSSPRTSVKNSTFVAAALRGARSRALAPRPCQAGDHSGCSSPRAARLHQRVHNGGAAGMGAVAALHTAWPTAPAAQPQGAARHRHLAQIEGGPVPPIRPRTMTAPVSGRRSRAWSGRGSGARAASVAGRARARRPIQLRRS